MEVPSSKMQVAFQNLRKLKQATLPFEIVKMSSKQESSSFKRQKVDDCDTDEVIVLPSDGSGFSGIENCEVKVEENIGCNCNSNVMEDNIETVIPHVSCQVEMMEESCIKELCTENSKTDMSMQLNESGSVSFESSLGILKHVVPGKLPNENVSVEDNSLVNNKRKIDSSEQPKAQKPPKRAKLIYHVDKLRTCNEKVSDSETEVKEVKSVSEKYFDEIVEVKNKSENSEENKKFKSESLEKGCNLEQNCLTECLQVLYNPSNEKDEVLEKEVNDVSITEEYCNTSISKASPPGKNVKKLTPKQLQRQAEVTKRREELQQEREQKKKKREEEKVRIKLEKEEEKRKLKEEKEKRKQAEIEIKIREKQQKDEEKKRKKEEQKLEDKRKKEELQKKKEEEELLKKRRTKEAEAFSNFFTKCAVKALGRPESDNSSNEIVFMPFTVKSDMRLAPINRNPMDDERLSKFEHLFISQSQHKTYLDELRSNVIAPKKVGNTWPLEEKYNDVIIVEDLDLKDEVTVVPQKRFSDRKPKLLQFCENRRPPYWGTWRKKSKTIRPKNPFGKDEIFDYEVDSDEEWEEEEPGESLHGSDDEKESEDEYEVDNDFFVPHGYLSDDENPEEEEKISPETQKAKLKLLGEQFDLERNEKTKLLKPITLGCVWFVSDSDEPVSVNSSVVKFLNARKAVPWQGSVPILLSPDGDDDSFMDSKPDVKTENLDAEEYTENGSTKRMPDSAVAELIDLIHGSPHSVRKLARMFVLKWKKKTEAKVIDKKGKVYRPFVKHIERKIKKLANWEEYPEQGPDFGKKCWYVEKEIREKYGDLDDLGVIKEEKKPFLITNFTKILTEDEKKNQMTKSRVSFRKSLPSPNSTGEAMPNGQRSQSLPPKCGKTLQQFWANSSVGEKYSEGVSAIEENMEDVAVIKDLPKNQDDCSVIATT